MSFAAAHERRGQPLLFLGLLAVGWVLIRVVTWEAPWPEVIKLTNLRQLPAEPHVRHEAFESIDTATRASDLPHATHDYSKRKARPSSQRYVSSRFATLEVAHASGGGAMGSTPSVVGAENFMEPDNRGQASPQPSHTLPLTEFGRENGSPWRFDGWLYLREGTTDASESGSRPVSYGASQVGAVLSYRLGEGVRAYARATHALVSGGDSEAALGLSMRPFPALPVSAYVEGRATQHESGTEIRPSAFLAGGMDKLNLPLGFKGSAYAQAGYVGGDFATAFVDGSARVERPVARFELGEIRLGAGGWGGAQSDAARLDFGPSVVVATHIGQAPVKVEVDYRIRVAGRAEPGSGLALTVIGGF